MFFCLTGRHVHAEASTANEALIFAATQSAPPLAKFRPDIGRHIATVIDRALAFSPDDRWQSAQAMREAITSAHANVDGVSVPPSHRTIATLEDSSSSLVSKSPGRRRAHLAAVAVTSLGLAGVLGNYARSTRATTANAEVTPSLGHIDEAPRAVPNPPTPFEDPARLAPAPAVEESSNVSPLGDRNAAEKVVASPPHRPKTAKGSATSGAPKPARGFPAGDTAAESLLDRRNLRPAWVGTDSPGDGAEASLDRRK